MARIEIRSEIRPERVEARMKALRMNIQEVQRAMGLKEKSTYLYNLISPSEADGKPKQKTISEERLASLATVLECSPSYLTGESDYPNRHEKALAEVTEADDSPSRPEIQIRGYVESGVFRRRGTQRPPIPGGVQPMSDYPVAIQSAYQIRDNSLLARGISPRTTLLCIAAEDVSQVESGKIVIVKRFRANGDEVEISARELQHFPNRTELRVVTPTNGDEPIILRGDGPSSGSEAVRVVALVVAGRMDL